METRQMIRMGPNGRGFKGAAWNDPVDHYGKTIEEVLKIILPAKRKEFKYFKGKTFVTIRFEVPDKFWVKKQQPRNTSAKTEKI